MLVGWTTLETAEQARRLGREAVEAGLAACAQIDGPLEVFYPWQGRVENGSEFRLTFKFTEASLTALGEWLHRQHPYDTPQWVVVRAAAAGEKYLRWARDPRKV
ncbi:MAG: divalent-cation tolerance protein CutA [Puniceicoccaceae bacterium]|nr:MAG: divalent-cation tolerance protein CutA [Puniceicoccaceae bacterium]